MKLIKGFLITVIFLFLGLYIWGSIYSIEPGLVTRAIKTDSSRIKADLLYLTKQCRYRNYLHPDQLNKAANYIKEQLNAVTDNVWLQSFSVDSSYNIQNREFNNVICSFGPRNAERVVIGAHYDACLDQEGADDNASGVCGLLELTRLLKNEPLKYRIDLVAYANEEPPFFGTVDMDSYVHAKSLHDSSIAVKGMIGLEMIGYYSNEPGSQDYPVFFLEWFYGNKGDFVVVTQKHFNGAFGRYIRKRMKQDQVIPTKSFTAPSWLGGINLSDHRNYWKFGYSAVMITNTSFFRNKNYHTKDDTAEKLDTGKMALVTDELYHTILEMP